MGLMDVFRSQSIGVIEWTGQTPDVVAWRYDRGGKDIMMGAQLIVRESQLAIFVNEGQLADVFTPGRYTLETQNLPVLTRLQAWRYGFNSPFKADVWFISTRQLLDIKWGTANPVMMRDQDFGSIRLRAFGSLSFRVTDGELFMKECVGSAAVCRISDVEGQIKRVAVSMLSDSVAESGIPALDLAANYTELAEQAMSRANEKLAGLGLALTGFVIENISVASESQAESVNMQEQSAAQSTVGHSFTQVTQTQTQASAGNTLFCTFCGRRLSPGDKFCSDCGRKVASEAVCPRCGRKAAQTAKFCIYCGQKL